MQIKTRLSKISPILRKYNTDWEQKNKGKPPWEDVPNSIFENLNTRYPNLADGVLVAISANWTDEAELFVKFDSAWYQVEFYPEL